MRVRKENVERVINDVDLPLFKKLGYEEIKETTQPTEEQKTKGLTKMNIEELKAFAQSKGVLDKIEGLTKNEMLEILKDVR